MKETTFTQPTDTVAGWPHAVMTEDTGDRPPLTLPGQPIHDARTAKEWAGLILALFGGVLWIGYSIYAISGMIATH